MVNPDELQRCSIHRSRHAACMAQLLRTCSVRGAGGEWHERGFAQRWFTVRHFCLQHQPSYLIYWECFTADESL